MYEILEAVRRSLEMDDDVHALIEDRIYPMDSRLVERLGEGTLPLVTFAMIDEGDISCGRIEGIVQIDVAHRGLEKKTPWDIHAAVKVAVAPRLLQIASETSPNLLIRVGSFKLTNAQDDIFDELTNTYRLRSQWRTLFVRRTS